MAFHLRCERPVPVSRRLDHELPELTSEELRILKEQIRRNAARVQEDVRRLELFLNKERYPPQAEFIAKIRRNLQISMEENDTFRRVLWNHLQSFEVVRNPQFRKS